MKKTNIVRIDGKIGFRNEAGELVFLSKREFQIQEIEKLTEKIFKKLGEKRWQLT